MPDKTAPNKSAIVLSGGGANGAFAVGVLKALASGRAPANPGQPLEPDIFAGTSIGAFNSSYLVSHWDEMGTAAVAGLEQLWLQTLADYPGSKGNGGLRIRGDVFEALNPQAYSPNPAEPLLRLARDGAFLAWDGIRRAANLAASSEAPLERVLDLVNLSSFVSREPFERTIDQSMSFSNIRQSSKVLRIAATNWASGTVRIFTNSDMTDKLGREAIMASSAIPGFFPVEEVGAIPYVDGGVLLNTPLKPAIRAGADLMHVIYLDPSPGSIPLAHLQNTAQTFYRMQEISWASSVNHDVAAARRINRVVEIIAGLGSTKNQAAVALREEYARYSPIEVHLYHPKDDLGGVIGLLDLNRERLENLIERGLAEGLQHDCEEAGCIIPESSPLAQPSPEDVEGAAE